MIFGPTHISHPHAVLVLTDATDEAVSVRSHLVDCSLKVDDFERHIAQPELVGHRRWRSGHVVGRDEAREFQSAASAGRPQHHDLAVSTGDTADGLNEFALHRSGAFHLHSECHEERRCGGEVRDGNADMVETLHVCHEVHLPFENFDPPGRRRRDRTARARPPWRDGIDTAVEATLRAGPA